MKKLLLAAGLLIASVVSVSAACVPPAIMHDFPGTAFSMSMVTNTADGNCSSTVDAATGGHSDALAALPVPLKALSSEPAVATTTNPVPAMSDLVGKTVTSPYANRENMTRGGGTSTTTGAITILPASGNAGLKEYLTDISCTREDAGTTAIIVTLNDTSTMTFAVPNNGGGGGYAKPFNVPLVAAANTAITATPSSGVTTLRCYATGFNGY
jgi:hypothetical protein